MTSSTQPKDRQVGDDEACAKCKRVGRLLRAVRRKTWECVLLDCPERRLPTALPPGQRRPE
jgi:hypothetical protein